MGPCITMGEIWFDEYHKLIDRIYTVPTAHGRVSKTTSSASAIYAEHGGGTIGGGNHTMVIGGCTWSTGQPNPSTSISNRASKQVLRRRTKIQGRGTSYYQTHTIGEERQIPTKEGQTEGKIHAQVWWEIQSNKHVSRSIHLHHIDAKLYTTLYDLPHVRVATLPGKWSQPIPFTRTTMPRTNCHGRLKREMAGRWDYWQI